MLKLKADEQAMPAGCRFDLLFMVRGIILPDGTFCFLKEQDCVQQNHTGRVSVFNSIRIKRVPIGDPPSRGPGTSGT